MSQEQNSNNNNNNTHQKSALDKEKTCKDGHKTIDNGTRFQITIKHPYIKRNEKRPVAHLLFTNCPHKNLDILRGSLEEKWPKNKYDLPTHSKFLMCVVYKIMIRFCEQQMESYCQRYSLLSPQDMENVITLQRRYLVTMNAYMHEKLALMRQYEKARNIEDPVERMATLESQFPRYMSLNLGELMFPWYEEGREQQRLFNIFEFMEDSEVSREIVDGFTLASRTVRDKIME